MPSFEVKFKPGENQRWEVGFQQQAYRQQRRTNSQLQPRAPTAELYAMDKRACSLAQIEFSSSTKASTKNVPEYLGPLILICLGCDVKYVHSKPYSS